MEKSKKITFRVSNQEYREILEKADEKHLSTSRYVAQCALVPEGLTKEIKQRIFWSLCQIKELASNCTKEEKIKEECDAIWRFLR